MNLGPAEIIVIMVLALLVFGPKRLPEVGRQVGSALREIRKVQDTVRTEIKTVIDDTNPANVLRTTPPSATPGPPSRAERAAHQRAVNAGLADPADDTADAGDEVVAAEPDWDGDPDDWARVDPGTTGARDTAPEELGLPPDDAPPAGGSFS